MQNYTAGNPAPVLYIKNLAKDVIADDFYFIFGELSRLLLDSDLFNSLHLQFECFISKNEIMIL